jgi:hypothetical protein
MVTAIPGAISPESSLGYLMLASTNYFCLRGVILILWMYFELLMSFTSD